MVQTIKNAKSYPTFEIQIHTIRLDKRNAI